MHKNVHSAPTLLIEIALIIILWACNGTLLNAGAKVAGYSPGQNNTALTELISLHCRRCTLSELLDRLAALSDLKFIYSSNDLRNERVPTVAYEKVALGRILDELLSPHRLTYKVMNGRIVIKRAAFSPTGAIRGKIHEADNPGELLVGASVRIAGTNRGTAADVQGNFEINNLPVGTYSLIISFVGYRTKRLEGIEVIADNVTTLEVTLVPSAEELEEILIKGDIAVQFQPIKNSTELELVDRIDQELGVVTGISDFQITRSLDRDAADVVKRVPGLSVLNNFVLVRGMNTRYTMTFINNMMAPSTETDEKAFNFNMLPSGLIDQILVYKSPRADLPGEWSGGVVKVETKRAQVARRIQVNASVQYVTNNNTLNDHYTYSGTSHRDWYTGGLNDRRYPALYYDPNYLWIDPVNYPAEAAEQSQAFPPFSNLATRTAPLDRRLRINYYDSYKLFGKRLNNLLSVGYSQVNIFDNRFTNSRFLNTVTPITPEEANELQEVEQSYGNHLTNIYSYEGELYRDGFLGFRQIDSLYENRVRISVLEQLDYTFNNNHAIALTYFLNRQGFDQTVVRDQYNLDVNNSNLFRFVNYEYTLKNLWNLQLSGSHNISKKVGLNWRAGRNVMREERPDLMRQQFIGSNPIREPAFGGNVLYNPNGQYEVQILDAREVAVNQGGFSTRGYFITEDWASFAGIDADLDLTTFLKLGLGGVYNAPEREMESYLYALAQADPSQFDQEVQLRTFDRPWFGLDTLTNNLIRDDNTGATWQKTINEGAYQIKEEHYAAYLDGEVSLLNNKLELYAGLRYEYYQRDFFDENGELLNGTFEFAGFPGNVYELGEPFDLFLPSFILTYNLHKKQKIKASYGKTIDRPAFREQTDFTYFDYGQGAFFRGNLLLFNTEIHNYDLRWEWYPAPSEFISIGAFYKQMLNPIELYEVTQSTASPVPIFQYYNSERAIIAGGEMEIRKKLDFLPLPHADRFSIILNAAYLFSESRLGEVFLTFNDDNGRMYRRMFGQSPYLVNGGLYYNSKNDNTNLSILYNVVGPRIVAAEARFRRSLIERERHLVDLVYSQRLLKFLRLKVGAQNILNAPMRYFRDANRNDRYDPGTIERTDVGDPATDFDAMGFTPGITYSFGLQFEF